MTAKPVLEPKYWIFRQLLRYSSPTELVDKVYDNFSPSNLDFSWNINIFPL